MKNKTYHFLAFYDFQEQVFVVLIDIKTVEIRIMKKMKDYLTKKCAGSGIRKNFILIQVKKYRITGSGSAALFLCMQFSYCNPNIHGSGFTGN
jgi:hypothetical protein